MRKLAHETLGFQKNALVAEVFHDFALGERVLTCDGVLGKVTAVLDGPFPQTEVYEVVLDRGIGGGQYTATQLSKTAQGVTAASLDDTQGDEDARGDDGADDLNPYEGSILHQASDDYPEMGTILSDRLPNENIKVYAGLSRTAALQEPLDDVHQIGVDVNNSESQHAQKAEQSDAVAGPAIDPIDPPDACSFCGSPEFDEFTNTGRGTRARCAQCQGTMTSWGGQWQPDMPNAPANAASRQGDFRSIMNDPGAVHMGGKRGGLPDDFETKFHPGDEQASFRYWAPHITAHAGGQQVGELGWHPENKTVLWAETDENHRRKGVASAMLTHAREVDPGVRHAEPNQQTDDAKAWTKKMALADYDPDFGFMMRATWADVRAKAKRIKDEGGVRILAANHSGVVGEVQGEHHLYEASFNYVPGMKRIADWGCGCKWASYAWGRSPGYKRFEGRQCSHVTALQYEAQSRGMFGRQVTHDEQRLPGQYQRSPVTVEYDRAGDKNLNRRSVPPGNMKTTFGSLAPGDVPTLGIAPTLVPEHAQFSVKANLWTLHDGPEHELSTRHHLDDAYSGRVHGLDTDGAYVGNVSYSLRPHSDEPGGLIQHEIETEPGYEHHAPGLFHALENHLQSTGLPPGEWSHDDEGHHDAKALKVEPHYASLDLAPVHAFTAAMVAAGDDVEAVLSMLGSYRVPDASALSIVCWAAQHATAPVDGGAAQPGTDIPGIGTRDQTERKEKDPKHRRHHTNDARSHAPEFGYGIAHGFGPLMWCDQCHGSGCGHCAGTGQVIAPEGAGATGGPAAGDASSTSAPVADQNSDAGSMIGSDGMSATGARETYYHATPHDLDGENEVSPPSRTGVEPNYQADEMDRDRVFMTKSLEGAHSWGKDLGGDRYKVYEVRPRHEPDQDDDDVYSTEGSVPIVRKVHGGLQAHELLLQRYADYSADSFLTGPPAQNYQAPTPHSDTSNPGSTGWATSADPPNWEAPLIGNDFASFSNAASLRTGLKEGEPSIEPPTVSGVALKAADTGRVLMIQRSIKDESDPARGTFEFPGGHHEPGDQTSLHAGIREWQEETGQAFPEGGHVSHVWRSGPYQGHVVVIPDESGVKFHEGRSTVNPDDPGGDDHEQSLWIHPDDASKMPNLRAELKKANPFAGIKKAARAAATLGDEKRLGPSQKTAYDARARDDVCRNCGEHVHETGDYVAPWVHSHSGNSFCDVHGTEDAAFNMGSPLHRDEAGPTFHESALSAPCETPGAQYSTSVSGDTAEISVKLPFPLPVDTAADADHLESHMHNAMEEILAPFFVGHEHEASRTSSVTSVTNPRGNGESATYKPREYNPFSAALHDAPEGALPSTDGEVDPSPALGDVQDIPPGMMLSDHPVQPWGYSAGDPASPAQGLIPGSADHDMVGTDSSGGTDAFRSEATIETAQTPEEIVAAFLATSAAKALNGEGGSGGGELSARQAAMAAAGGGASVHSSGPTDSDIAAAARQAFEKTAMKDFDFAEQQELISEGAGGPRARNFDDLQIAGTHYAQLSNDRGDDELLLA